MRNKLFRTSLVALSLSGLAMAQEQPPVQDQTMSQSSSGGWRRFGDGQNGMPQQPAPRPYQNQNPAPYQNPIPVQVPSALTLPAGTWLTVRTTNPISTDHNQVGDAFSAVLTEPLVVNGFVIARRGQTIQGRVATSEKAGRVSGTSKLGLELTQLSLVDGQQVSLHSQMVQRDGGTSFGRDAAAIGTTTAVGAAIGAGVNGGVGAGVGAAGGLVASTIGVLLTRGKPSVVYPETVLTFKVIEPIMISTVNSAGAFQLVGQQDYERDTRSLVSRPAPQRPGYAVAPYPYYGYPYYYGPSYFSFGYGGGFYRGGFYGRGFHR